MMESTDLPIESAVPPFPGLDAKVFIRDQASLQIVVRRALADLGIGELMGQGTETAISAPLLKSSELFPEFHASALRELADILAIDLNGIPLVFHPAQPKALKIGVDGDIRNRFPATDMTRLGDWLGRWCGSSQYLTQLRDGLRRYDLDGHDAGEIPASQRVHAAGRLAQRIKRSREKKRLPNKSSEPTR